MDDKSYLFRVLAFIQHNLNPISALIIGHLSPTAKYVQEYARSQANDIPVQQVIPNKEPDSTISPVTELISKSEQVVFIWDGIDSPTLSAIKHAKEKNKQILIFPSWGPLVAVWQKGKLENKTQSFEKLLARLNLSEKVILIEKEQICS